MTDQHNTVLVDGRGQAHEGRGHDVFDEVPYERLNRIRIIDARLGPDSVVVRGDATAAYEPGLGLTRFERSFRFTPKEGFVIEDDLSSAMPRVFTTLVHADDHVKQVGPRRFGIVVGSACLSVDVVEPQMTAMKIEPNMLTGPGAPGSVDKGERQQRGQRLAVSTAKPVTGTRFVTRLVVE